MDKLEHTIPVVGILVDEDRKNWMIECMEKRTAGHPISTVTKPEPDNPFDPRAVAVIFNGKAVGYLPRYAQDFMLDYFPQVFEQENPCRIANWGMTDRGPFCDLIYRLEDVQQTNHYETELHG